MVLLAAKDLCFCLCNRVFWEEHKLCTILITIQASVQILQIEQVFMAILPLRGYQIFFLYLQGLFAPWFGKGPTLDRCTPCVASLGTDTSVSVYLEMPDHSRLCVQTEATCSDQDSTQNPSISQLSPVKT